MTSLRLLVIVLAAVLIALALFLFVPPLLSPSISRFSAESELHELAAYAPQTAGGVLLVDDSGAVWRRLRSNAVTAEALDRFAADVPRSLPWILGNAPLVAWNSERGSGWVARPDPVRRTLIGLFRGVAPGDVRVEGGLVASAPLERRSELPQALKESDLEGEFFLYAPTGGGAFPPIDVPSLTGGVISRSALTLTSRGLESSPITPSGATAPRLELPREAMAAMSISAPPPMLDDMERLLPGEIGFLLEEGGGIVIYEMQKGKLLPVPRGVVVVPAQVARAGGFQEILRERGLPRIAGERRESVREQAGVRIDRVESIGLVLETAFAGESFLVAFDGQSIDQYLGAVKEALGGEGESWSLRIDPVRLAEAVESVRSHPASRILGRRVRRTLESARAWGEIARRARVVEIEKRITAEGVEEVVLRAR